MIDDVDVKIPQHEKGNLAENSLGGTELLTMELFLMLPQEYKDKFQFVISRVHKIEEDKRRLYWIHDLALDPAHSLLTTPSIDMFDKNLSLTLRKIVVFQIGKFPKFTPRKYLVYAS